MTFAEVVAAAVREFTDRGFESEEQLAYWVGLLREAAEAQATSAARMRKMMDDALRAVYARLVENAGVLRQAPGVSRYTLAQVSPRLRAELDRRIAASASLIRLNRDEAIETTLRRFSGWATSVPRGGAADPEKRKTAEDVKKAVRALPFIERRVVTDQGHKLSAAITSTVAEAGGAIAGRWHSHWRQANYDYRDDHKARDGRVWLVRGSWADAKGYVKGAYVDAITQPGEEVYCRCSYTYIFHLRDMPAENVTAAGRAALEEVRKRA